MPRRRASSAVTALRGSPARSRPVRNRCVARSRSPRRNQSSPPSRASSSMTAQLSPATPHPVSRLSMPARVYVTVSRSGQMERPCSSMSSPTLTIAVMSRGRDHAYEPGEHSSGPDAAAQGHQHAASIRASGRGPFPPAPGTIAARHASAYSRGSARDRGVRPAGGGTGQRRRRGVRRAGWQRAAGEPDLRGMGPGGRRRGRPPRPPRGRQGRRRLPAPAVEHRVRRLVRRAAPARGHHLGHQPAHGSRRGGLHRRAAPRRCSWCSTPRPGSVPTPERWRWSPAPRPGAGGTRRGPTPGRSWPRPTRWPWSGPAGRPGSPRARSSITPTWPRWRVGPTC